MEEMSVSQLKHIELNMNAKKPQDQEKKGNSRRVNEHMSQIGHITKRADFVFLSMFKTHYVECWLKYPYSGHMTNVHWTMYACNISTLLHFDGSDSLEHETAIRIASLRH